MSVCQDIRVLAPARTDSLFSIEKQFFQDGCTELAGGGPGRGRLAYRDVQSVSSDFPHPVDATPPRLDWNWNWNWSLSDAMFDGSRKLRTHIMAERSF